MYSRVVASMGWHGLTADALRWQLPGGTAAAMRGRLAGELIRRWPPMVCVLLNDLSSPPRHAPAGRDGYAHAAAVRQPDSAARDATGSLSASQPSGADLDLAASAREQPAGIWAFASELLQALRASFHRVTGRQDTLRRGMLQAVGEFCTWLLRQEHRSVPQPVAQASDEGRPSAESVLRTAVTVMHDVLSDWGPAAAASADSAACYSSAMARLLSALNAALARDLAAMTAENSSTMSAFQERCHLKARLLLCSVPAVSCTASPRDDREETAPASDCRLDIVRARSVFGDAVATAALWAALQGEFTAARLWRCCRDKSTVSACQFMCASCRTANREASGHYSIPFHHSPKYMRHGGLQRSRS